MVNITENHADKTGYGDKDLSKSWQSALITLVFVFIVGFFALKTINQNPAKSIYVEMSNLTLPERESLNAVMEDLGEVPFFDGDLHQIRTSVMALSWVEQANVSRDWYHGIMVEVTPRKPIANFGSEEMVDANGVVFRPANSDDVMNPALVTLHGSPHEARDIMRQMQYINEHFSPVDLMVEDLILTARHTWIIRFNNGLRVVVDGENTEQKLFLLAKVLKTQFAERIHEMQSVDLRYKNGFAISWKTNKATS